MRCTIRDLLWLTLVIGMSVALWLSATTAANNAKRTRFLERKLIILTEQINGTGKLHIQRIPDPEFPEGRFVIDQP
jgi:hypothetical protein